MRVLVLYASDLAPRSKIAPGGITANLRGYLGGLPADWDIEVWGATEASTGTLGDMQTISLAGRSVRLRSLVHAGHVVGRRIPLSIEYSTALARMAWRGEIDRPLWDVVIAHRTEYLAAVACISPFTRLPPSIAMIHGSSAWGYDAMPGLSGRAYMIGEKLAIQRAHIVALVSNSALPYYRSHYPRRADRFRWIPNGVDTSRFAGPKNRDWRTQHGFTPNDRVLVYHGRYDREKGIERALDALRILRNDGAPWHLVCAGVGPLSTMLAAAAESWGKGFVHDLGYLNPEQIVELLQAGDLGLLCSDFEGLSNGLLEAVAAGLPVVATDAGDNALIVGKLAPELIVEKDPDAIAKGVHWAWERRGELAQRAPMVAEEFSLTKRISRLTALFRYVALEKPPSAIPEFAT